MAKSKVYNTVKIKESIRKVLAVLIVFVVVAMIMSHNKVAEVVGNAIGVEPEKIQALANDFVIVGLGVLLVVVGWIALAALPFVGAGLALVGGALIVYQVLSWFVWDSDSVE